MLIIFAVFLVLITCFAGVLLVGAPYLPTLTMQVSTALELAGLKPGQTLIELGCGDGKVLIAAARQGLNVTGYELNPILAAICWLRTRRYRRQVRIVCADFWRVEWPVADAIFTFLLPKYMTKLDTKVVQYNHKPVKLVSFAFPIAGKKPVTNQDGVYLYSYK